MEQAAGMAEFSGNELLLNDTGNNNTDGDDIAFSGVFQVGPNQGDTVTIETVRCHPDSLFATERKELIQFTVTDALAAALATNGSSTVVFGGVTGTVDFTGDTNAADVIATLNASTDAAVTPITFTSDGNVITGTYDTAGAIASNVNSIHNISGVVTREGTTAAADADTALDFSTQAGCQAAITTIQAAYDKVAKNRAQLGAVQAQMESTIRNLANVVENTTAARSRIQDADFAAETAALTRAQMLQQAATSILAQANAQPQNVLELLR